MLLRKLRMSLVLMLAVVGGWSVPPASGADQRPPADKPARTDRYGEALPPGALLRLGTIRLRQRWADLAFDAEGKRLVSAGEDQIIRHWDAATGKEVRRILLRLDKKLHVQSPVVAADGKSVAGYADDAVRVWDAATGQERRRISVGKVSISALALAPDGKMLAVDSLEQADFALHLWNVATGKKLHRLAHKQFATALAFSADGKLLGAVDASDVLRIWESATGKAILTLRVGGDCLAISPHGQWVALGDFHGNVKIWDLASGKERPAPPRMPSDITALAISPDGKLLAIGTWDDELILWDVAAREQRRKMPAPHCLHLRFAPDGKTLASSTAGAIHLWDVATGKEIASRPGHNGGVGSLAISPDGKVLATVSPVDKAIHLWDPSSGELLARLPGHKGGSYTCAFSADGKRIVSGGRGSVRVWDRASGKELRSFTVEPLEPRTIQTSVVKVGLTVKGDRLTAFTTQGTNLTELQIDVWDMHTGKRLAHRPCPFGRDDSWTCLAPDGRRIAAFNERGTVVVEDAITGQALVEIPGYYGPPLLFSPDGQVFAAARYQLQGSPADRPCPVPSPPDEILAIPLTELATGKPLISIKTGVLDPPLLAFSSRGRVLATGDPKAIHLWDVATGRELLRQPLPKRPKSLMDQSFVTSLAFLPDDRLATGLADSTILIWDTSSAVRRAGLPAKDLDAAERRRLWSDLASTDASKAHQAVWTLAAVPARAVPFLKDHLHPASPVDAKQLQRLIDDLDSPAFSVREDARQKLASFGEQAEPALRQALEGKPSLEARKRLEALHADAEMVRRGIVRSTDVLRTLRAIRTLEHIGSRQARQVLQTLADGDPAARSTRQARAALRRLANEVP